MSSTSKSAAPIPAWLNSPLVWTVILTGVSLVTVILSVVNGNDRWPMIATLAAVVVAAWFILLVRHRDMSDGWRGRTFLVVLVVAMGVGTFIGPEMQYMMFIAYPLTWVLTEKKGEGIAWTWILSAVVALSLLLSDPESVREILGMSTLFGVFSTMMGLWIYNIVAWGLENEQMRQQLQDSQNQLVALTESVATQRERDRLAREVHDTLAQGFVSVITLSQAVMPTLQRGAVGDPELAKALGRLELIETVARDNLAESRALIRAWKPPVLDDGDLALAIDRLVELFDQKTGITCQVYVEVPGEIGSEAEVVLLRVAQEALNNVQRHARATEVTVEMRQSGDDISLTITDDGIGRGGAAEHTGLSGMRERLSLLGGTVQIEDAGNPAGTVLIAVVPRETRTTE